MKRFILFALLLTFPLLFGLNCGGPPPPEPERIIQPYQKTMMVHILVKGSL